MIFYYTFISLKIVVIFDYNYIIFDFNLDNICYKIKNTPQFS